MEWLPIETAPKGERPVLLFERRVVVDNGFQRETFCMYTGRRSGFDTNAWVVFEYHTSGGYMGNPTHWMPLPSPPNAALTGSRAKE